MTVVIIVYKNIHLNFNGKFFLIFIVVCKSLSKFANINIHTTSERKIVIYGRLWQ